jgi:hypothetical protein
VFVPLSMQMWTLLLKSLGQRCIVTCMLEPAAAQFLCWLQGAGPQYAACRQGRTPAAAQCQGSHAITTTYRHTGRNCRPHAHHAHGSDLSLAYMSDMLSVC